MVLIGVSKVCIRGLVSIEYGVLLSTSLCSSDNPFFCLRFTSIFHVSIILANFYLARLSLSWDPGQSMVRYESLPEFVTPFMAESSVK